MAKKSDIPSGTLVPEVVLMNRRVILEDLPTSVRGFVFLDDDGEPVIVVNSRLSREQNRKTYDHESNHIDRDELNEPTYNEYGRKEA